MSKTAWCKNCGEQIERSSSFNWHHVIGGAYECFRPVRLVAEPDRDRSAEEDYLLGNHSDGDADSGAIA